MEKSLFVASFLLLAVSALGLPLESSDDTKSVNTGEIDSQQSAENSEYGKYFEGDMILNQEQLAALYSVSPRNGVISSKYYWPNKTVHYQLSPEHTTAQNRYILEALETLENVSCIKFKPRTNETNYVQLTAEDGGCYSSVGFQNRTQILNLKKFEPGKGCFRLGTIMHEFLHALGFYHMQSAHDRDEYVKIDWQHILPGTEHNFKKYNSDTVTHFNMTYDYESVLHYGANAFSKDGMPTIIPVNESYIGVIGQRTKLSEADIIKLNKMYECDQL